MNKEEMIQVFERAIDSLGIQRSDIVIIAGSAMLMYGLREVASDIDSVVTPEAYRRIMRGGHKVVYNKRFKIPGGKSINSYKTPELGLDFCVVNDPEFIGEVSYIEGVPVCSPEAILRFKRYLDRPKDVADIKNLINYIEKRDAE